MLNALSKENFLQIIDVSLTPGDSKSGHITPVVGIDNGRYIDYDRKEHMVYWLQSKGSGEDTENGTLYTMPYTGGNRTEFPNPQGKSTVHIILWLIVNFL